MQLLIPFASTLSEAGTHALRDLPLPQLGQLLAVLAPGERLGDDEYSLSPPHERALATAWGWRADDGALPWAALHAQGDGIATGEHAWGELTPVHWHVGRDHISLADPQALKLDDVQSREFLEAIRPLFASESWQLAFGAATRWYAAHDTLAGLPCASLDRVIGRNVDLWLPPHPQARLIRRLQNEVQMLLYDHPLNDAREARGELPVNSFWLSGCGRPQPASWSDAPQVDDSLRAPALAEDWAGWADAWRALDAGPVSGMLAKARRGEAVHLVLCGERHAQRFQSARQSTWQRLTRHWRSAPVHDVLEAL
ncbi:hypothetical protein [Piscinibacter sp. XHJ-5]|uniref:hypothetical protein n=1 Tax=Piscinibacter sp. XHJ-5 TaxID=3037797 RepID=UPI0024533D1A|nr:hypothetical protein [Piscinibacter sp. XHJ-5]